MKATELKALLHQRYAAPEWAFFAEVANGTGGNAVRRIDGLAMNLYPSRGLRLHGFEIKVSRADFNREMKDPEKAEAIAKYCHHWWVVCPAGLVGIEELPPNWGLLTAKDGTMRIAKQAELIAPERPSYEFIAAVLRRASESSLDAQILKDQYDRGHANGMEYGKQLGKASCGGDAVDLNHLRESVRRFKQESGIEINDWNGGQIGAELRQYTAAKRAGERLQRDMQQLLRAADAMRQVLELETGDTP